MFLTRPLKALLFFSALECFVGARIVQNVATADIGGESVSVSSLTPNLHNSPPPAAAERSGASERRASESCSSASHALKNKSKIGKKGVRRPLRPREGQAQFFTPNTPRRRRRRLFAFRAVDFCCSPPATHLIAPHARRRQNLLSRIPMANSMFRVGLRPPRCVFHLSTKIGNYSAPSFPASSATVNTPFITI